MHTAHVQAATIKGATSKYTMYKLLVFVVAITSTRPGEYEQTMAKFLFAEEFVLHNLHTYILFALYF